MRTAPSLPRQQRGALLILLVIALGILAVTLFVGMLSSSGIQIERDKKTAAALAEAKAALIGWSVASNTPGKLPCPEDTSKIGTAYEGDAQSSCNTLPAVGRLPWRTLGVGDLRDGYGEKLWYVISSGFRTSPINSNTLPQLTVDGVANSALAIVFSAGPAIGSQIRPQPTASSPPLVTNYLDGSNNDGDNQFVTSGSPNIFNDHLLTVKQHDLFSIVERRIAGEIIGVDTPATSGLRFYYATSAFYPYAGDSSGNELTGSFSGSVPYNGLSFTSSIKSMLINNKWFDITTYQVNSARNSAQLGLKYCTEQTTLGQQGTPVCY